MTKNNAFKKAVRAYKTVFGVSYMSALKAVSSPIVVTPEMVELSKSVHETIRTQPGGMILITGPTSSGKTFLQHYIASQLVSDSLRVIEIDRSEELTKWVQPLFNTEDKMVTFSPPQSSQSYFDENATVKMVTKLRPDVISLPELRYTEGVHKELTKSLLSKKYTFLGALHHTKKYNSLDRYFTQFRQYDTEHHPPAKFVTETLKMVIEVDRVNLGGKSLLTVSHFKVTSDAVKAWTDNNLDSFLEQQNFVHASVKKQSILGIKG